MYVHLTRIKVVRIIWTLLSSLSDVLDWVFSYYSEFDFHLMIRYD